jgi:chemotaxis response regulator CheB
MSAEYLTPFPTVMLCTGARRTGTSALGSDLALLHAATNNPSVLTAHMKKMFRTEFM